MDGGAERSGDDGVMPLGTGGNVHEARATGDAPTQPDVASGRSRTVAQLVFKHPRTGQDRAIVKHGSAYTGSFDHASLKLEGRGVQLRVGPPQSAAAFCISSGTASFAHLLDASDALMSLDVAHGTMVAGTPVNLWGTVGKPEWKQRYTLGADATIGPARQPHLPEACTELCLGMEDPAQHDSKIVLVPNSDVHRRIVFGGAVAAIAASVAADTAGREAALPPTLPGTTRRLLLLQTPACPWLGDGQMALSTHGVRHYGSFEHGGTTLHGIGMQLRVGPAHDATEFEFGGPLTSMTITHGNEPLLSLDVAHNKCVAGTPVNLWGTVTKPEWRQRYMLGPDGTISPVSQALPSPPREGAGTRDGLCLGVTRDGAEAKLVLVRRDDLENRVIIGSTASMQQYYTGIAAQREVAIFGPRYLSLVVTFLSCCV